MTPNDTQNEAGVLLVGTGLNHLGRPKRTVIRSRANGAWDTLGDVSDKELIRSPWQRGVDENWPGHVHDLKFPGFTWARWSLK